MFSKRIKQNVLGMTNAFKCQLKLIFPIKMHSVISKDFDKCRQRRVSLNFCHIHINLQCESSKEQQHCSLVRSLCHLDLGHFESLWKSFQKLLSDARSRHAPLREFAFMAASTKKFCKFTTFVARLLEVAYKMIYALFQ